MTVLLSHAIHVEADDSRVTQGLQALYTFDAGQGDTIADQAGSGQGLDLRIDQPDAIEWRDGSLHIRAATRVRSTRPATAIIDAIKRSSAATVEAWIQPDNDQQAGPARIVSLSRDSSNRNFTLGQDGNRFDVRFRTTATDNNGLPSTATPTGAATTARTHVAYTIDSKKTARLYINGKQAVTRKVKGDLSKWNDDFSLLLANEESKGRPWLGTLYLVAIYSRDLSGAEIERNFRAGADSQHAAKLALNRQARQFETRIAPLIARHCLDCHDSAARKGQLDLSRKSRALAGGESGLAIVPGHPTDSLLWSQVAAGDMPPQGQALSDAEKADLHEWIESGAVWTLDVIDPAVYAHDDHVADNWIQRLTIPEYIETVRSAVGIGISKEARELLPPDVRADGFSNTAYNLNVDLKHVESYARLAEIIVARMDVLAFAKRFSNSTKLSTDDTMRDYVAAMGKWLLRGPLDDREVTNFSGIATTVASAGGDFAEATGLLIEAMLQSPRFIYRVEGQRGDGTPWPAGEHELASRMSYIVWGGPPDEELMRLADSGKLRDRAVAEKQIDRMLADPRAVDRSLQFLSEWLNLNRLNNLRPDRKRFPAWNDQLAADMRDETRLYFKEIVWDQHRPLADLFNAQVTFVTPALADHYGLDRQVVDPNDKPGIPAADKPAAAPQRYELSSVPGRGGLLTQGSLLTIGGDDASMVTRGLFVLHDVLRGTMKAPPPCVDTTPVPSKPGLSQRGIAEQRIADVACGGCHTRFEPLAFGLEKFDGLGAYHDRDPFGNTLRDDGEILFPGAEQPVKYASSAELMTLLAESERVRESILWKLAQFTLGRPLVASDLPAVQQVHHSTNDGGATWPRLIKAIILSDLVQLTKTQAITAETNQ